MAIWVMGGGAQGKIPIQMGSITRHTKFRHPEEYMKQALDNQARSTEKLLKKEDTTFEFMLNIARLKHGFTAELFEQRTWLAFSEIEEKIQSLIEDDLILSSNRFYKPSEKGYLFVNDIVDRFL